MGALELRNAILERTALLPESLLQEVYDFVEFLNLKQQRYLSDLEDNLSVFTQSEITHVEEEFLNYKELYPREGRSN
ncbi:DUF2281 domain-containing protein [Runella salmonicolor]|uniref:DUF2281 domain-containing protein n=1 Tax=Runella salmonicolor TaxID=2950278 RepID=A0ABT1FLH2_9BACT|nr:DUF2281 domain-containing protein [Runella salmonicolor]MCP1382620.1 DUF2281 domain-containing protein [Runella salmonicolor]